MNVLPKRQRCATGAGSGVYALLHSSEWHVNIRAHRVVTTPEYRSGNPMNSAFPAKNQFGWQIAVLGLQRR